MSASRPGSAARARRAEDAAQHVDGYGENDGRVLVAGDVVERRQKSQLPRLRRGRQGVCGLEQPLGRLKHAFGIDDPGSAIELGLRLAGDGADQAHTYFDNFELEIGDIVATALYILVYEMLQVRVQLVACEQT